MNEFFNKYINKYTISFLILIILLIIIYCFKNSNTSNYIDNYENYQIETNRYVPNNAEFDTNNLIYPLNPTYPTHPTVNNIPHDIIRNYDHNKIDDPLEEPTRRIPRHDFYPHHMKKIIDIPTRGYPDNFSQFGTLVQKHGKDDGYNHIIRLFGRQIYPGSHRYEYYTMINSGNDQIKIPLRTKNKELFDGDEVYIKELKDYYEVQLHNFDAPKYYPDIIY